MSIFPYNGVETWAVNTDLFHWFRKAGIVYVCYGAAMCESIFCPLKVSCNWETKGSGQRGHTESQ